MQDETQIKPKRRSRGEDYVNNKEFSEAVAQYAAQVIEDKNAGREPRMMSNYIAESLLKIAQGLARSPNFMNYSYRDDMVMDAVENCVKVVSNYDIDASTRGGAPNAFGYFTLICFRAFLRRIAKEKKQTEIKENLINSGLISAFIDVDNDTEGCAEGVVERMRSRRDTYSSSENLPKAAKRKRRAQKKKNTGKESLINFL